MYNTAYTLRAYAFSRCDIVLDNVIYAGDNRQDIGAAYLSATYLTKLAEYSVQVVEALAPLLGG